MLEVNAAGTQIGRNIYGTNLLMRTADGLSLYYMYNGHADVTALIDATTGKTRATYYYDAFGNIQEQKYYTASGTETTTPINNSIMFAGYQYDKETGLYYLNARMYDPKIARFLQEDTYRGNPNDPLSLNLYTYCANNPLIYWDPTGHSYLGKEDYEAQMWYLASVKSGKSSYQLREPNTIDKIIIGNLKNTQAIFNTGENIVKGTFTPLAAWIALGGGEMYNWFTNEDEVVRQNYRELMLEEINRMGSQDSLFKPLGNWIGYGAAVIDANARGKSKEYKQILHEVALKELSRSGPAAFESLYKPILNTLNKEKAYNFFLNAYETPMDELDSYASDATTTVLLASSIYGKYKSSNLKVNATFEMRTAPIGFNLSPNGAASLINVRYPAISVSIAKTIPSASSGALANSMLFAAAMGGDPGSGAAGVGDNGAFKAGVELPSDAKVIRGGVSDAKNLQTNQAADPNLTISARGGMNVSDTTLAEGFKNGQISKTTVGELNAKGYKVISSPTAGNPYHVDIVTPKGALLTDAEAANLSSTFSRIPNPAKPR